MILILALPLICKQPFPSILYGFMVLVHGNLQLIDIEGLDRICPVYSGFFSINITRRNLLTGFVCNTSMDWELGWVLKGLSILLKGHPRSQGITFSYYVNIYDRPVVSLHLFVYK